MNREDFAKKSDRVKKREFISSIAMIIVLALLLCLVILIQHGELGLVSEIAKNQRGWIVIVLFVGVFFVGYLLEIERLKANRLQCRHCHEPIRNALRQVFVMSGFCPKCGKQNFEET